MTSSRFFVIVLMFYITQLLSKGLLICSWNLFQWKFLFFILHFFNSFFILLEIYVLAISFLELTNMVTDTSRPCISTNILFLLFFTFCLFVLIFISHIILFQINFCQNSGEISPWLHIIQYIQWEVWHCLFLLLLFFVCFYFLSLCNLLFVFVNLKICCLCLGKGISTFSLWVI